MHNLNIDHLIEIIEEAGGILQIQFGKPKVIDDGNGEQRRRDFTTKADLDSLAFILAEIHRDHPDDGFIAEGLSKVNNLESLGKKPDAEGRIAGTSGYFWVADPLCGTIMHSRGIPEYAISLALVTQQYEIVFGMVFCPPMNDMYYAEKGSRAYKNGDIIKVSDVSSLDSSVVSISHRITRNEDIRDLSNIARRIKITSSCGLDIARAAAGNIDAVIVAKQPLYDYAAGLLILQEAGGTATDFNGNKPIMQLGYQPVTDLLCSNRAIHQELLRYTKEFKNI